MLVGWMMSKWRIPLGDGRVGSWFVARRPNRLRRFACRIPGKGGGFENFGPHEKYRKLRPTEKVQALYFLSPNYLPTSI